MAIKSGGKRSDDSVEDEKHDKELGDDSRTIFVRNLPYTLTDLQLQEVFSEIGPVRWSFTVKERGSEQHRGFGFVQFAVLEDAFRAVEAKQGTDLQGRKIKVELAKRRPAFEQRRSRKHQDGNPHKGGPVTGLEEGIPQNVPHVTDKSKKRKAIETNGIEQDDVGVRSPRKKKPRHDLSTQDHRKKREQAQVSEKGKDSSKQRVSRTVILGGLTSPEMREEVIMCAKNIGSVESLQSSLSPEELKGRGLEKDGCKMGAAAVVYTSVKAASLAVATLHQKSIGGGIIWARQLGGEGSKPKKWRVIIRNLPFKVSENEVRELFSPVGFVWEITIPHKDDGLSKGFAFASFTSKADVEKAIRIVNGKTVGKRPVAVDWAVAKNMYEKNVQPTITEARPEDVLKGAGSDTDDDETASESEQDDLLQERDSNQGLNDNTTVENLPIDIQRKQSKTSDKDCNMDCAIEERHGKYDELAILDEMDMARRVLKKVVSSLERDQAIDREKETQGKPQSSKERNISAEELSRPDLSKEDAVARQKRPEKLQETQGGDMKRSVFIKNLPFEAEVEDIKKHFIVFGKVKSIHLVRHPITKRPKGTAFLEFSTEEAAEAAVAAGAKNEGDVGGGIVYGGRRLEVLVPMDKKSAQALAKERQEKAIIDQRNIYLAKEGKLEEGTAATDGVSKEDLQKRKQLEQEKATKLRSPNFHVSRTRLAVYNVPKSMKEVGLKQLFIDAVKLRATRQQPVIKQVKILKDEKKGGKSRGVAFVEFSEHQHALVALRMLNNNPGTFTKERRPIVEFAIENLQTLKRRKERQTEADRRMVHKDVAKKDLDINNKKSFRVNTEKRPIIKSSKIEGVGEMPNRKRKERTEITQKYFSAPETDSKVMQVNKRKKQMIKNNSERSGPDRLVAHVGRKYQPQVREKVSLVSGDEKLNNVSGANKDSWMKKKKQKLSPSTPKRLEGIGLRADKKQVHLQDDEKNKKRKRPNQNGTGLGSHGNLHDRISKFTNQPKQLHKKRNSKPEIEDKLDKLVAEYRNKYFSDASEIAKRSNKLSGIRASNDLKRWFE